LKKKITYYLHEMKFEKNKIYELLFCTFKKTRVWMVQQSAKEMDSDKTPTE